MPNPFLDLEFPAPPVERFQLRKTFRGHLNSVAAVAFHPRKPILATVSDDQTWKLWSVPDCDLIMSGEGHRDWISGVDFHPAGSHLVTSSGDKTVKLWDFAQASCAATFTDHTQAVWDVSVHHSGDFMASCSMDHTTRLWDLNSNRCRQTFRGHVDSVNSVVWQPFSNNVCTGSGDKTVSLWDARTGLCVQVTARPLKTFLLSRPRPRRCPSSFTYHTSIIKRRGSSPLSLVAHTRPFMDTSTPAPTSALTIEETPSLPATQMAWSSCGTCAWSRRSEPSR